MDWKDVKWGLTIINFFKKEGGLFLRKNKLFKWKEYLKL